MKDVTVRINSVLGFIQNCNLLTANEILSAHQLASNFINARYPAGNAGQVAYDNFSNGMSLGAHIMSDPNNLRQMKRASYLLDRAIRDADPASPLGNLAIGQISNAAAQVTFENYLRKAANKRESATGATASAQAAMQHLFLHPLAFLQTNKLFVNGSAVRDLTQGDQNVLTFYFGYNAGRDRFQFDKAVQPGYHAVQVDSVTAQWWTSVPNSWVGGAANAHLGNFSQIAAIELASPIMVTTQFTGCAFSMKAHGGHTYCAHLTPTRDPNDVNANHAVNGAPILSGTQLAQRVRINNGVNGDFANAAGGNPLSIYGAAFSHNVPVPGYPNGLGGGVSYMTIIGVLRAPGYEIYSQITQNNAITSQQIF
jgi:hypothetical protein